MKIGMNLLLWTAAADASHLPLIADIRKWGFDGIELPMFSPDCSPWDTIRKHLGDLGMTCTAVCVLPADASLISDDAAARKRGVDHLKASIDSCVKVGAEAMGGPIYHPVGALIGRGPTEDERKRCVECLREVGKHAEQAGVDIAFEPLNRFETFVANSQEDTRRMIDAIGSKAVGILYDTFHANIEEKSLEKAIRTAGDKIVQVHVSANDRATPGEDHIDYATTFRTLKAIGFDGWYTIESFGSRLPELAGATCIWRKMAPSEEHVARQGIKFIREMLAKA